MIIVVFIDLLVQMIYDNLMKAFKLNGGTVMYKLIVCDMDETLLADNKTITPKTVEAIKRAVKKGVRFSPNTGRGFLSVQDDLEKLGLKDVSGQYVISNNGAVIVENKNNRIVKTETMKFETVNELFRLGIEHPEYCVHIYTPDELYIWNLTDEEFAYIDGRLNDYEQPKDESIEFLKEKQITKIIFSVPSEGERLALQKYVQENFEEMNITFSSDRYIEFNSKEADKGQAALHLGELLGIKPEEIIAIGDNGNDVPMIKAAGLGVSVANGREFVKEIADYVTEADNNHDPVAEVIEKFID